MKRFLLSLAVIVCSVRTYRATLTYSSDWPCIGAPEGWCPDGSRCSESCPAPKCTKEDESACFGPPGAKCILPEGYCGYPQLTPCEVDDECDGGVCINSVCVNPSTGPCLAEGVCPAGETCIEDECYEPGFGPIGGPLAPLSPANSSSTLTGGDLEADDFPDYTTPDVAVHGKVNEEL